MNGNMKQFNVMSMGDLDAVMEASATLGMTKVQRLLDIGRRSCGESTPSTAIPITTLVTRKMKHKQYALHARDAFEAALKELYASSTATKNGSKAEPITPYRVADVATRLKIASAKVRSGYVHGTFLWKMNDPASMASWFSLAKVDGRNVYVPKPGMKP